MNRVRVLANQPDEAPEDSLLRWFNYHLRAAHVPDTLTSFGELQVLSKLGNIRYKLLTHYPRQDCRLLAILLHQLEPTQCDSSDTIMKVRAMPLLHSNNQICCADLRRQSARRSRAKKRRKN